MQLAVRGGFPKQQPQIHIGFLNNSARCNWQSEGFPKQMGVLHSADIRSHFGSIPCHKLTCGNGARAAPAARQARTMRAQLAGTQNFNSNKSC